MEFLIYQDYVHNTGALHAALSAYAGSGSVGYIDAAIIRESGIPLTTDIFFMPGGAGRYVSAQLDGAGNDAIRAYVGGGGRYFGICAGAYYACRRTEWRMGREHGIGVDNELAFYDATAIGPINDVGCAADDAPAQIVHLMNGDKRWPALYWAGPQFAPSAANDVEILASFDLPGNPAAVLIGSFGQGSYVLSSPHPEIDAQTLDLMQFDVPANRYAELSTLKGDGLTRDFFHTLLDRLLS